ncbi:GTP-binding protein [Streptomyces sp. NRRL F-4489]|nr:GTP-binding protein [Streptomyces sp. NRRL F-4489]
MNIGILAHVDAGKTSLTERLLYDAGAIDRLGSVDAGDTQTDTGFIERQRGITVRSAVASFTVGGTQINLIDTPGHSDFVAEVERVLGVLDGAVLVLSAVEGVQAHTRVLMRTLRAVGLPVLLFVNKIDRSGARRDGLLADIRRRLVPRLVPMTAVRDAGTPSARAVPQSLGGDPEFRARVAETLAESDDALLARVIDGPAPSAGELRAALAEQVRTGRAHPVYFGSARTGQGISHLVDGIATLLRPPVPDPADEPEAAEAAVAPEAANAPSEPDRPDASSSPQGTVFAVERAPSGKRTALVRLFSGSLAARQRVTLHRRGADGAPLAHTGQITSLEVVGRPGPGPGRLSAGEIGRIGGLAEVRIGDRLTGPGGRDGGGPRAAYFPPPTFRTLVRPREAAPGTSARLYAALRRLSEEDPLIHATPGPEGATSVLLHGEIQKEIIAATLAHDFGIDAVFEPSSTVFLERPAGVGEAYEEIGRQAVGPGGFWATVGLRVAPAPRNSGVIFRYETELGALPRAFHAAIEETVHAVLREGPHGWAVTDCAVTLIRSGFASPVSTAGDFRGLTRVVLRRALACAGTRVYEPCHAFEAEIPIDALPAVTSCLAGLAAQIRETAGGHESWLVKGVIPASRVRAAERRLPGLTRGEALWWSRPDGDRPVSGAGAVADRR